MRILCNGLGGFEAAAWALEAEHEIVRLDEEHVRAAWSSPDWQQELLPEGWVPDVAIFWSPEYRLMPPAVWDLPCPVALWVGDWYVEPNGLRELAPHVDLVLTDAVGAERARHAGIPNVDVLTPWTFDPAQHMRSWDEPALYDLSFIGSLNDVIHLERNQWLRRILDLPEDLRILVSSGVYGEQYGEVLRRTRIGFNYTVAGGVNMRTFEVPASGSLLMVERHNTEVGKWFRDGEQCVLYGPDDFEDLVRHFLDHEDERRAIAEAGWARAQELAPANRAPGLVERLEALASAPRRRTRPSRVDAARIHAFHALHMPEFDRPFGDLEVELDAAEAEAPQDTGVLVNRALLYSTYALMGNGGLHAEAVDGTIEYLERAVALDPDEAVARFDLASVLHGREDHAGAEAHYRELLARIDAGTAVVRPGRLLFRRMLDDFFMSWLGASFAEPAALAGAQAAVLAAETAERLGAIVADRGERLAFLHRALAARESVETRRRLAGEHVAAGDVDAALEQTETALAIKPLYEPLWKERVVMLLALGRRDEAEAAAAEVARLAKRMPPYAPLARELAARVGAGAPIVRPAALGAA